MLRPCKYAQMSRGRRQQCFVALAAWVLFSGVVAAQDLPSAASPTGLALPTPGGLPSKVISPLIAAGITNNGTPSARGISMELYTGASSTATIPENAPTGVRRITLPEAQQLAEATTNPLVRLGQLQVEIAKQHRESVQAQYFPNISGTFYNMHLNKEPGEVLTLQRPLVGEAISVPVNLIERDQTAFNFSATQPITPLFAVHQLVKIARADETIAKVKAGMPIAQTASKVEKNYFDLLIAERELISAQAEARMIQSKWLTASSSGAPSISAQQEADLLNAEKLVAVPAGRVELTTSLNELIGFPDETRLELISPEPLVENVSEKDAIEHAPVSPEVVEAEQTSVKARAGSALSKMQYFPSVAVIGGYANQNFLNVVLPRDFAYIGFMATYTVFDFGKREHEVKEATAQAQAASLGVELTKAKVTSALKASYSELERSRQFAQLARRMASAATIVEASYKSDDPDVQSAQAKMEAEMFRAELEYRQAYTRLKILMGDK